MRVKNILLYIVKKTWRIAILSFVYRVAPIFYRAKKHRDAELRSQQIEVFKPELVDVRFRHLVTALWPVQGLTLIRVGAERDGGYLIPKEMGHIDALFSPGVATVADFEEYFADRGVRVFLADGSVDAPPIQHDLFEFIPKFIGNKVGASWISFPRWISETGLESSKNLALQMDIEGGEYDVFMDITARNLFPNFKWIAIELHDLHLLGEDENWSRIDNLLSTLAANFKVVHVHANNNEALVRIGNSALPPVLEVTFANIELFRDEQKFWKPKEIITHPNDRQNSNFMPKINLDHIWAEFRPI